MLYRVLAGELESFLARVDEDPSHGGLPGFVVRELRAFLRCGILQFGFARVFCESCRRDALVAFSCKGRGICPSCGARRMADTAAWLVDRVLPETPLPARTREPGKHAVPRPTSPRFAPPFA